MFRLILAILLFALTGSTTGWAQTNPGSRMKAEWNELFNGTDLNGWTQRGGKAKYSAENGEIVGTTVPNTTNSFLCTEKTFGDFELELEFLVHPELNSGIQIRSESSPDVKNGVVHGYQVEIDPADRAWTAGIYDESRRGWLDDLSDNRAARYAFRQGEWNHVRVFAVGDHLRTWLNGVPAADLHDDMTASGFIALQVHGVGKREDALTVRWKNIRIRENPSAEPASDASDSKTRESKTVFPEPENITKLADGFAFTEGPALGPDGKIHFNDIPNSTTHVFDPTTRKIEVFRENTGKANGLYWSPNDALISCEGGNRRVTRRWNDEERILAESYEGKKLNSPNDLVLDGFGGVYFTDPRYGNRDDMEMDVEGVYYITREGKLTRVVDDLLRPNGIILSPDNHTLYLADQAEGKTWAWDVTGDGKITNRRLFAEFGSDGMTIDTDGNVYLTWDGSIIVISPEGKEIAHLKVPEAPANCTLVGETLYITARTGFYSVKTNRRGLLDVPNPD